MYFWSKNYICIEKIHDFFFGEVKELENCYYKNSYSR